MSNIGINNINNINNIINIINKTTSCGFTNLEAGSKNMDKNETDDIADVADVADSITLKYINDKYYIENFIENDKIKCKLIKNIQKLKMFKSLPQNSIIFKFKVKDIGCFMPRYYSYLIEIQENEIQELGLLTMNIYRILHVGSYAIRLLFVTSLTSQF